MTKVTPIELLSYDSSLRLSLGLQAPVMTPHGVILLFCRIIGDGNKNLQHLVQVFVKVLSHGNELAEPATADHMVCLLGQMQGSLPPQVRTICSSSHMSPSTSVHQGAALIAGARLQ